MLVIPARVRIVVVMVSALALAAGLLTLAKSAQAQAETITDTDRTPFNFESGSCSGELVFLEGTLHTVSHTTIDANGGFHTKFQFNLKGQGEGAISGDKYVYHDVRNQHINSPTGAALNFTITENLQIIRQGSATPTDDLQGKVLIHVTVNAQGEVTADVTKIEFVCK